MERLSRLVRQKTRSIVASALRILSDTSRMHIMVVQGDAVFDALCSIESRDSKGMQRAMLLQETDRGGIPVRTRVFGEYALTLVVLEWPLNPSEKSPISEKLLEVIADAIGNQRHIDGITLIADELALSENPGFYSCFVETYNQLRYVGHPPFAIVQHCENSTKAQILPFDVLYFKGNFITPQSLHQLLSKKVDRNETSLARGPRSDRGSGGSDAFSEIGCL